MSTRVLIQITYFDDYFNLLYKFKFNDIEIWEGVDCIKKSKDSTEDELKILLQVQNKLKEQIKNLFEDAIVNDKTYLLEKIHHQFISNCPGEDSCSYMKTEWIETDNKIKLYKYFLFDEAIINYWFVNRSYGIYFNNDDGSSNSDNIDTNSEPRYGIEYLDLIGYELCLSYNFVSSRYEFTTDEINMLYNYKKTNKFCDDIIKKMEEDVNAKLYVEKCRNYVDYKNLEKIYSPKKYLSDDGTECWDLLEIFDVFLNSQMYFGINSRDPVIIKKL